MKALSIALALLALAAALAPAAVAQESAPIAIVSNVATTRASPFPELAVYALLAFAFPSAVQAAGIPPDPERNPFAGSRVDHPLATAGVLSMHDKLAHATAGAELLSLSFTLDSRTGREPCLLSAARGALRAVAIGALYEGAAALVNRSKAGQPGYGFGWGDQGAIAVGALTSGALTCGVRLLTR